MKESDFEFEITPGERLPPETRMELPEMSYEQELVNMPVPFAYRVEFLSDYVKLNTQPITAQKISKVIGIAMGRLNEILDDIKPEIIGLSEDGDDLLERYTLEVVREEVEWQETFDTLGAYVAVDTLAKYLARHHTWVRERLNGLGLEPILSKNTQGHLVSMYPKESLWMLRTIMLHFPPANDWYTTDELAETYHRGHEWVRRTLESMGIKPVIKTSPLSGVIRPHYPADAREVLDKIVARQEPAGNWLTVWGIAQEVGRHVDWVKKRIAQFEQLGALRLDNLQREKIHYPPEVVEEILKL